MQRSKASKRPILKFFLDKNGILMQKAIVVSVTLPGGAQVPTEAQITTQEQADALHVG